MTISSSKASFAADENVLIEVTLKNNESYKPVRVLDWVVPCDAEDVSSPETPAEMSFFAVKTAGGHVAKYLGAVFKRVKPDEKDYKMLKPGDEVRCTIDLGRYYQFDSIGDDNSYEIKYSVSSTELSNPNVSDSASALERLDSNSLTIKIDARNIPTRALRKRQLQTSDNIFRNCDAARQNSLVEARSRAGTAANDALGVIESVGATNSLECPRYTKWFGNYESTRHDELLSGYRISRDQLISASITFDCGCKQ